MPGKKRKRTTRTRTRTVKLRGRHNGDPVSIQISVRLKRVPKGMRITKRLLEDMIRRKAESSAGAWDGHSRVVGAREGKDPSGIELKIQRWKNPDRQKGRDRSWRSGSQADAWGSLRQIIAIAPVRFLR